LGGEIDVRAFERAGLDAAEIRRVARPAQRLAGDIGFAPGRTTELLQALRIRKARQCDLAERRRLAIGVARSEEHTSELQSLMRISYAVFCLKKKNYTRR